MDVTISIQVEPCGEHVIITYSSGGRSLRRRYTLTELRQDTHYQTVEEAEDAIMAQMRKVILENPTATKAQLKTILEAEVYKI